MSKQLSLIDYPSNDKGEIYEPEKSIIVSAFISDEVVTNFERRGLFEEFRLYENSNLDDFVAQTRIRQDMIDQALREIQAEFIRLLESEGVDEVKKIQSDESVDTLIYEFNSITNIYHVLRLKKSNFSNVTSAIIKLG